MSSFEVFEYETGPNPVASLIVMHGLGASGQDFVSFVDELDLEAIGPVRFLFPNAPAIPVTLNGGYVMPAWYDIVVTDLGRQEDEQGLRRSQRLVEALLQRERERGVPSNRIVLAGFSQGCAMTLMAGLRQPERLAGLAGMSGYLPIAETTEAEAHAANRDVPIFLAHGTEDPVVTHARGELSRDMLLALGYDVEWHAYPMPHTVIPDEVRDLNRWLLDVLAR